MMFNRLFLYWGMCDVEGGIALVGVSEEPILMGIHDATMVSLYKTRYPVWFYIIFILPHRHNC